MQLKQKPWGLLPEALPATGGLRLIAHDEPWLHRDGRRKTDDELRAETPKWTPADWENYLDSLESYSSETLLDDPRDVDNKLSAKDYSRIYSQSSDIVGTVQLRQMVHTSMRLLTPRERKVIQMRFWKGLPWFEVALGLGVNQRVAKIFLKRALKKLKQRLLDLPCQRTTSARNISWARIVTDLTEFSSEIDLFAADQMCQPSHS